MNTAETTESIEEAALGLDPEGRAKLAHKLVESLRAVSREQMESLWLDEAERRAEELDAGVVEAVPGEEVFARLQREYKR